MQTVTSNGSGNLEVELPVSPGKRFSLYVRRGAAAPSTGTLYPEHRDSVNDYSLYDSSGSIVYWDASAQAGQTFEFVAQTDSLVLVGNLFGASKDVDYSLTEIRS